MASRRAYPKLVFIAPTAHERRFHLKASCAGTPIAVLLRGEYGVERAGYTVCRKCFTGLYGVRLWCGAVSPEGRKCSVKIGHKAAHSSPTGHGRPAERWGE